MRNGHKDNRKRYSCGKAGHIKSACPGNKIERKSSDNVEFVLEMSDSGGSHGYWLLDSGLSRHLVNDVSMLENPKASVLQLTEGPCA